MKKSKIKKQAYSLLAAVSVFVTGCDTPIQPGGFPDYTNGLNAYNNQDYAGAITSMMKAARENSDEARNWLKSRPGNGQPFWDLTIANETTYNNVQIWIDGEPSLIMGARETMKIPFLPGSTHVVNSTFTTEGRWLGLINGGYEEINHSTPPRQFIMNGNAVYTIFENDGPSQ